MSDLPPYLRIKKVSLILLKLCTPTGHDELIFFYFRISAKQICCGFTECRLARGVPMRRLFLIMSDLPPYLPIKKVSLILLKLYTPTGHDELIFLYFWISAKQICCGFTECRLASGVPTCPRGANFSRKGASHATPLFLIMNDLPPYRHPDKKSFFTTAETLHAHWP